MQGACFYYKIKEDVRNIRKGKTACKKHQKAHIVEDQYFKDRKHLL